MGAGDGKGIVERNIFAIPENFEITVPPMGKEGDSRTPQKAMEGNPQTDLFSKWLGLSHIVTEPYVREETKNVDFFRKNVRINL